MFHTTLAVEIQLDSSSAALELERATAPGVADPAVARAERHDHRRRCWRVRPHRGSATSHVPDERPRMAPTSIGCHDFLFPWRLPRGNVLAIASSSCCLAWGGAFTMPPAGSKERRFRAVGVTRLELELAVVNTTAIAF